jgi:hypothetical protein
VDDDQPTYFTKLNGKKRKTVHKCLLRGKEGTLCIAKEGE